MNEAKKNRLEEAKLAKAYMAGGMAPYQAARKCGFMRVGIMEEAIRELENAECQKEEADTKIPEPVLQSEEESRYLAGSVSSEQIAKPVFTPERVQYKPLQTWNNSVASIAHYGQNGDKTPAYRVQIVGKASYLTIPEEWFEAFVRLCGRAAGLVTDGSEFLKTELADVRDTLEQESKAHLHELKTNEKLRGDLEALKNEKNELVLLYQSEKTAHDALKIRVLDLLLSDYERNHDKKKA